MKNFEKVLNSKLFSGLEADFLEKLHYQVKKYKKGETVALEGDKCDSVAIVINGEMNVVKEFPSGRMLALSKLDEGDLFGEVIVFSEKKEYPATILAKSDAEIMFISRKEIIRLQADYPQLVINLLEILSEKLLKLNKRLSETNVGTIEAKIAGFILEKQKETGGEYIKLNMSREDMAKYLSIPRPSLSREMSRMSKEGIIDFYRDTIKILDYKKLEDCVFGD